MCETIEGPISENNKPWSRKEAEEIREKMLSDLAKYVSKDDDLYHKVEKKSLKVIELEELGQLIDKMEKNGIRSYISSIGYMIRMGKYNRLAKELRFPLRKDYRNK